jgi:ABC-type dipeptide/oligopeptide/nickel transport system permease component
VELAVMTMAVACLIGIPAGVISAIRQDRWLDYYYSGFSSRQPR